MVVVVVALWVGVLFAFFLYVQFKTSRKNKDNPNVDDRHYHVQDNHTENCHHTLYPDATQSPSATIDIPDDVMTFNQTKQSDIDDDPVMDRTLPLMRNHARLSKFDWAVMQDDIWEGLDDDSLDIYDILDEPYRVKTIITQTTDLTNSTSSDNIKAGETFEIVFNKRLNPDTHDLYLIKPNFSGDVVRFTNVIKKKFRVKKSGNYYLLIDKKPSEFVRRIFKDEDEIISFCSYDKFLRQWSVKPNKVDVHNCSTYGFNESREKRYVSKEKEFFIALQDSYENLIEYDRDIQIQITGPNGRPIQHKTYINNDRVLVVQYKGTKTGEYMFSVSHDRISFTGFLPKKTMTLLPQDTTMSWKIYKNSRDISTVAGELLTITVLALDIFGNPRDKGGDKIDFFSHNTFGIEESEPLYVKDNNDGTYSISFQKQIATTYIVSSSYEVIGCPLNILVKPGSVCNRNCVFSGMDDAKVGIPNEITFLLRDQYDNYLIDNNQILTLKIEGKVHSISTNTDGAHFATFIPQKIGDHRISLVLSTSIQNTILKSHDHSNIISVKKGIIFGKHNSPNDSLVKNVKAGEVFTVLAILKDENGEILKLSDENNITPLLSPSNGVDLIGLQQRINGKYEFQFCPKVKGQYDLHIMVNGTLISNWEYQFDVECGKLSQVQVHDHDEKLYVNDISTIIWETHDEYCNPIDLQRHEIEVQIIDEFSNIQSITKVRKELNLFHVDFCTRKSGMYTIRPIIDYIQRGEFKIRVENREACADNSYLEILNDAYTIDELYKGIDLTIIAIDEYANINVLGGDKFTAQIRAVDILDQSGDIYTQDLLIEDNNNGTYFVLLANLIDSDGISHDNFLGSFEIHVKLNGKYIQNSPCTFEILPGITYSENCYCYGPGLNSGIPYALARPSQFLIQAIDLYGNRKYVGGDNWRVTLRGSRSTDTIYIHSGSLDGTNTVFDNHDGTYTVKYFIKRPDNYNITVELLGNRTSISGHIRNGECLVRVHQDFANLVQKREKVKAELGRRSTEVTLSVIKNDIYEEAKRFFMNRNNDLVSIAFRINFVGEKAIDLGGPRKEWYTLLARELFIGDMGSLMWTHPKDNQTKFHPSQDFSDLEDFNFAGRFIAKVIWENIKSDAYPIDLLFSDFLIDLILGNQEIRENPGVEFLKDFDPSMYETLKKFLTENIDPHMIYAFFEINNINLKENGNQILVNNMNKKEYVDLMCRYNLYDRIRDQIEAFLTGFYEIIPVHVISIFNKEEFIKLIRGEETIDVNNWRQYSKRINSRVVGQGGISFDQVDQWLWDIISRFDKEQKKRFLKYCCGIENAPMGGFGNLDPQFTIFYDTDKRKVDGAISSSTCTNKVMIPMYTTKDRFEDRIMHVIVDETHLKELGNDATTAFQKS